MRIEEGVRAVLGRPRGEQVAAIRELLGALPAPEENEAWNTAFGPGSLFEAWTRTSVARGVYAANAAVVRERLDAVDDWVAVEVGAGNGALWERVLREGDRGRLVAIDPAAQALSALAAAVPAGVVVEPRVAGIEGALPLPEADVVVCSLTLHHVAGRDREERARHGLSGIGKLEVLRGLAHAVRPRDGLVVLSEADVHCEVDLASGSAILRDRIVDSYLRRCGRSLLDDLEREPEGDLADRWRAILRHWCLEQLAVAEVPVAERDVYELDVGRWLELMERAGLAVIGQRCTDRYGLFHQYLCRPA